VCWVWRGGSYNELTDLKKVSRHKEVAVPFWGGHFYFIRKRGSGFASMLSFGGLSCGEPEAISDAIGYAKFRSRSHDAVIRVYDEAGNVIENA
jgi:hypothetical protein